MSGGIIASLQNSHNSRFRTITTNDVVGRSKLACDDVHLYTPPTHAIFSLVIVEPPGPIRFITAKIYNYS